MTQMDSVPRTGWRPVPLPLKVLCVAMLVWALGSAMNLPNLMQNGLPFFGSDLHGTAVLVVVACLDFLGPLVFFYALWNRKPWGVSWAALYIGLFVFNGVVALLTLHEQLGVPQILAPIVVSSLFLAVIFWQRSHFLATRQ